MLYSFYQKLRAHSLLNTSPTYQFPTHFPFSINNPKPRHKGLKHDH